MASHVRSFFAPARFAIHSSLALLAACAADTGFGSGRGPRVEANLGSVSIALTGVPDRVRCLRLEVVGGGTSTTSSFGVAADQREVAVRIGPLAYGTYTMTAYAYDVTCSTSPTPTPSWRSSTTSVAINAAHDDITLRPYSPTEVEVDFKPYIEAVSVGDRAGLILNSEHRLIPLGDETYTDTFLRLLSTTKYVFSGQDQHCVTMSGGELYCMGNDLDGSLGNGTGGAATLPVQITELTDVIAMDSASRTVCAVTSAGQLSCWGDNADGQIVPGVTTDQVSPVLLTTGVRDVAVGTSHICHVTHNGTVACRGSHAMGQLGESLSGSTPGFGVVGNAIQVEAGGSSTYALLADGTVASWGANSFGQLGNGTTSIGATPTPQTVASLVDVVEIAAATESACARTKRGEIWCWGAGNSGNLGNGKPDNQRTPVLTMTGATSLTAGPTNYCVTTTANDLMCWGRAFDGLFGGPADDTDSTRWVPTLITGW